MPSLLVTGGCGFIGSNFIRLLLGDEEKLLAESPYDRLINLDALSYAGNPANLADFANDPRYLFAQGSIGDARLVASLLADHQVTAVVNFAAESHVDRSIDGPEIFVQTNVVGTQRLLEQARHHWQRLPSDPEQRFRFLHISTDEVFGSLGPKHPPFCESTPFAPSSPYAASKAAADHLVRAYRHTFGLPTLATHCSNNYGPFQFPEKLIPLMILNALEGKPLPVYGDGRNVRDWLFVEDHCRALWEVLLRGRPGESYCIGGRNEVENLALVETLCDLLDELRPGDRPRRELIEHVQDRPGHDRRYAIDCSKIERDLDWRPRESFPSGLRKTVQWYLENQDWAENIARRIDARQRLGGPGCAGDSPAIE